MALSSMIQVVLEKVKTTQNGMTYITRSMVNMADAQAPLIQI